MGSKVEQERQAETGVRVRLSRTVEVRTVESRERARSALSGSPYGCDCLT